MAGVPVGWMAQVLGMIKNGDANVLAGYVAIVIHPIRAFAPDGFLAHRTLRIHHAAWR